MRFEFLSQYLSKKAMWMSSSGTSSIIGDTTFRSFFTKSGNPHLKLSFSRKLFIPYVLYFFSLSGVFMRFWYSQLLGFVRIRMTITTKWKSSASFRQSIQKTSVRLSHLSRYVVFQIPLIWGFQHSSSSTNIVWMKVFPIIQHLRRKCIED